MSFHEPAFLFLFLPLAILLLNFVNRTGVRLLLLSAVSIGYYGLAAPNYLPIFAGICLFNVALLVGMRRIRGAVWRHRAAVLGAILNLLPLIYYKYSDMTLVNELGGVVVNSLVIPLGISFYTFQIILFYVSGDYRRSDVSVGKFVAFVTFFPQLVLGPIQRYQEIVPQLLRPRINITWQVLGLLTIGLALVKKRVLAQALIGPIQSYDAMFAQGAETVATVFDAWFYMLANTAYIYLDFSAYADLAVGIGLLLGIKLIDGFASPFRAGSIAGFWRSWNTTLMRFLRETVYLPIVERGGWQAGYRASAAVLVMVAVGIWHGPGLHFVLWGLAVSAFMLFERFFKRFWTFGPVPIIQALWVIAGFVIPITIFLNPDLNKFFSIVTHMFQFDAWRSIPANIHEELVVVPAVQQYLHPIKTAVEINRYEFMWLVGVWVLMLWGINVAELRERLANLIADSERPVSRGILFSISVVAAVCLIGASLIASGASGFFYFQF